MGGLSILKGWVTRKFLSSGPTLMWAPLPVIDAFLSEKTKGV